MFLLPGGCQPRWDEGPAFAAERERQRDRLFAALQHPETVAADAATAFEQRLREGAILAARDALEAMRQAGSPEAELARRGQHLNEQVEALRQQARDRVERLRQDLATLLNLDLASAEKVRAELDRLDAIARGLVSLPEDERVALPAMAGRRQAEVPPDFPELEAELARMEADRDHLRDSVRRDQRERLELIARRPESRDAGLALLTRIASLDPVTLDDLIADIQAGRPAAALDDAAEDEFRAFYPAFVTTMAEPASPGLGAIHQRDQSPRGDRTVVLPGSRRY